MASKQPQHRLHTLLSTVAPFFYLNLPRFRLSPDVTIAIGARVKRSGEQMETVPTELKVLHRADAQDMDAYERLLSNRSAPTSSRQRPSRTSRRRSAPRARATSPQ